MEKRLKYLLGFGLIGLGLLINHTFGLCIEAITLPITSNDFSQSSNYHYCFQYSSQTVNGTATPDARMFGYYLYYNGSTQFDYRPVHKYANQTTNGCPSEYNNVLLNSGVFNSSIYTGSCYAGGGNAQLRMFTNMPLLPWNTAFDSVHRVLLGNGNDFGQGFVYVGTLDNPIPSPKYGFGGGFFHSNNRVELNQNNIDWSNLRLFYNQNVNLSSPLDGFQIGSNSGSNIKPFIARQYFTPQGFRYQTSNQSSPKTFGDFGGFYKKGFHVGGYGMGYSFGFMSNLVTDLTWNDWNFASVGSKCVQGLMELGTSDPNSQTNKGCQQPGFLVLKGDTYVSRNNNASVVVLSKDPENHQHILYEQFDCAEDDIQRIFNTDYCNSIGYGYITINGTGNILPFTGSDSTYRLGDGNNFLDNLLSGFTYGYVLFNSTSYRVIGLMEFGLIATPMGNSISYYFNNGYLGYTGTVSPGTTNTGSVVGSSVSLYYLCQSENPPEFCYNENGVLDIERFRNCTMIYEEDGHNHVYCVIDGYSQEIGLAQSGSGYIISVGSPFDTSLNVSDGYSEGYLNSYLNTKGYFFKCPFAYDSNFVIRPKLISMIGIDFNLPINCTFAAYNAGMETFGLSGSLHLLNNGPILNGDSDNYKMLYMFLDIILSLGFILLFVKIFKLFR